MSCTRRGVCDSNVKAGEYLGDAEESEETGQTREGPSYQSLKCQGEGSLCLTILGA